jgi:serine/threonine protein kinase
VSILAYLRKFNYVHRDIKPANMLLNERWQLVLADFGTAVQINKPRELLELKTDKKFSSHNNLILLDNFDSDSEGPVGTQAYISPEGLANDYKRIGFGTDLWSFGVIVWQLFSDENQTPFESANEKMINDKIHSVNYEMPKGAHVTPEICDLIDKLLVHEPTKRLGAANINDLLNHPVFTGVSLDSIYDEEPSLLPRQKKLNKQ